MRILTVDIGTSWAKLAVYDCSDGSPRLRHSDRVPSGVGTYDGSAASVESFLGLCDHLETAVGDILAAFPVDRIGLTSIREGLVLLDGAGEPLWVSGNALLDDERLLDLPIGDVAVADLLPEVLAGRTDVRALLSVPGFVASRLTGQAAVTASELSALGLARRTDLWAPWAATPIVAEGASLGPCRRYPQTDVYLAGTDEQASHHGAGVGNGADVGLATATFWSLTAPAAALTDRPDLRFIPAAGPYAAMVSIIGYRWGPYLQEALDGQRPTLPGRLPRWAVGELLDVLRAAGPPDREAVLTAVVADLRAGLALLARAGLVPDEPTVVVHGGALVGLRPFLAEVMQRVGWRWVALDDDATQRGCALVGMLSAR
ncbi:hypothetical protein LLH23_00760 [bacterium]|nr:hypothetical protein [bacterium]